MLRKQHTAIAKDAIAARGAVGGAHRFATLSFSEGDTEKVRQVVTAKQWAKTAALAKMVFAKDKVMKTWAFVEVCPKHFHIFLTTKSGGR